VGRRVGEWIGLFWGRARVRLSEGIWRVVMWASVLNRGSSAMKILWTYCRRRWRWPNS